MAEIFEETDEEKERARLRQRLAAKLARDPSLRRSCQLFAQAVFVRASSPDVAHLACGVLLDFELHRRTEGGT